MHWVMAIVLFLCGVLGAANLITARMKKAGGFIKAIEPFEGVLGIVAFGWGIWTLIHFLLHLGAFSGIALILMIANILVLLALGFLLAFPVLSSWFFEKNLKLRAIGMVIKMQLSPFKGILGIVAIVLAVWGLFI